MHYAADAEHKLDDVLCELRPLIAEVLGVNGDEIVASARFIEDLGVG